LRFNAQIARRINDFDFRGGLIESTGGFGIDYRIQNIGTKISLEAFDYKKSKGANVRFGAETQLWNVVYGRATVNDSLKKKRSGTVAAGLRFNDEDLKGLLGFSYKNMERNWLIRTTQNQILGPVSKAKVLEFLQKGALGPGDEVCSGNGYWFYIKEKDLVDKYLHGDVPQGYNPISESISVLLEEKILKDDINKYSSC